MMKDRRKEKLKLLSLIIPITAMVGLGGKLISVLNGYQDEILEHKQMIKQLYYSFDEAKHYKQLVVAQQDKKMEQLQDGLNARMSRIEDNLINLMFKLDFKLHSNRNL
jgi:hypothetical protein